MGWRLVEEILDHAPDLPAREFRVLIALAVDARDATRRGMPGYQLLARRGNCRMRTVERTMRKLSDRGLIKKVEWSAPDRRAVWEILALAVDNPTPASMVAGDWPDDDESSPATVVAGEHPPLSGQHPPLSPEHPPLTVADPPSVPPSVPPSGNPSSGARERAPAQAPICAWCRKPGHRSADCPSPF